MPRTKRDCCSPECSTMVNWMFDQATAAWWRRGPSGKADISHLAGPSAAARLLNTNMTPSRRKDNPFRPIPLRSAPVKTREPCWRASEATMKSRRRSSSRQKHPGSRWTGPRCVTAARPSPIGRLSGVSTQESSAPLRTHWQAFNYSDTPYTILPTTKLFAPVLGIAITPLCITTYGVVDSLGPSPRKTETKLHKREKRG